MVRKSKFTRWHSRSIVDCERRVTPSSHTQLISLHAWLTEEGLCCSLYEETRISARDQNIFNDDEKDNLSLDYFLASLSVVLFCVNQGAVRYI